MDQIKRNYPIRAPEPPYAPITTASPVMCELLLTAADAIFQQAMYGWNWEEMTEIIDWLDVIAYLAERETHRREDCRETVAGLRLTAASIRLCQIAQSTLSIRWQDWLRSIIDCIP